MPCIFRIDAIKANEKLSVKWQFQLRKFKGKEDLALAYFLTDHLHIYARPYKNVFNNMYSKNDQDLTHAQVLEMVRNY